MGQYPFRVIEVMTTTGKVYKVNDARDGLTVSDHDVWSAAVRKAQRCYREMAREMQASGQTWPQVRGKA